jgi:phenylalanyl-tRNA synthetase beta chain
LFDKDVPWALIEETIRKNVYRLEFIEEYHGDRVPEGKKSLTFRVWYRSDEGTLTSGQIAERSDSIIKKLTRRLGGQI